MDLPIDTPIGETICLIGLTGQAGVGKDTVAERLCDVHHFAAESFAAPIKSMLEALLSDHNIDHAHLYERALKESPIPIINASPRRLMQLLGTEWGRSIDPDLWVRLAAQRVGLHNLPHSSPVHDRLVMTDVRFANEAAWIRSHGGRIVRISRPGTPSVAHHSSETQPIRADYTIDNSGTVPELMRAIDRMLYTLAGPMEV